MHTLQTRMARMHRAASWPLKKKDDDSSDLKPEHQDIYYILKFKAPVYIFSCKALPFVLSIRTKRFLLV
jgi:hypothetical protein